MSATGLDVFDSTIQKTNIWLDEITDTVGPDRQLAWHILGSVLRALRDRLPLDEAVHLGAQLPLLIRGLYYDRWHPASAHKDRRQETFVAEIAGELKTVRPVNVNQAIAAVFRVLGTHVTEGQAGKVAACLPADIRQLWPAAGSIS
jgi:uncharacterized protein (DUF2267 family)